MSSSLQWWLELIQMGMDAAVFVTDFLELISIVVLLFF